MNPNYPRVAQRAGRCCEYCHAPEAIFNFPFEVEHIIPVSQGGPDDEANLALACRSCNVHKADHLTGVDDATQNASRLYHPRQDQWDEHFRLDKETGMIQALTSIGRATVTRLQINSPVQVAARLQWIHLGLFP